MHSAHVNINPELIRWARERAGYSLDELSLRFKKLPEWESGAVRPTLNQLEDFARKVYVPVGSLFCSEPPDEQIPITDFRTIANRKISRPSPDLLDTIYLCQSRQDWFQEYALVEQLSKLEFIGSASVETPPEKVAADIVKTIGFDIEARQRCSTWIEALRHFIRQADKAGILVMTSGIVGSNTARILDPNEFRGFALSDSYAPLVFINGADTKSAQIFTLAHELAHLWLGESGLSDSGILVTSEFPSVEVWCNAVAAELLVPLEHFCSQIRYTESNAELLNRLARLYKVSTLVILRRMLDTGRIDKGEFEAAWNSELSKLRSIDQNRSKGGDFYRTAVARVGYRFAYALVTSTIGNGTLYRDAFQLLGINQTDTFNKLASEIGVKV